MSRATCPDELIDRERSGTLGAAERDALEAHLASCADCRLERRLHADFDAEGAPRALDDDLVARAVAGAIAPRSAPVTSARRRWLGLGLAATLLFGLAAAAELGVRGRPQRVPEAAPPPEPTRVVAPNTGAAPSPPPPATAEPPPPARAKMPSPPAASARGGSAAELYARANAARRSRSTAEALSLYRELVRAYPGSREALTSRVAVARLLLDSRGDATGALRELDAYLAQAPGGTLAEEALAGRAECLGRLGRGAEERAAWQALLDRFPATVHRSRAEARLESASTPD